MNKVILVGRLTKDPEIRESGGKKFAKFSVAVNRPFKNKNGEQEADFPHCAAFDKTAEFVGNYFKKGYMIGVEGRLQTGSYVNKDGNTVYTTDVMVEHAEFVERKSDNSENSASSSKSSSNKASSKPVVQDFEETESDDDYPF